MLPAPRIDGPKLADVLRSSLDAVSGRANRLGLAPAGSAVVLLVDGLGAAALKARSGHARTLAGALTACSVIDAGFPTTTAAALATLTTGVAPGQHGLVGYSVLDPAHDRVVNQLSGWDADMDPAAWQTVPTLFESAAAEGADPVVVAPERYRDSGFTHAVLRGARFIGAETVEQRIQCTLDELGSGRRRLVYLYVPELDKAAHAHGVQSDQWIAALEQLDAATGQLVRGLGRRDGLLVTADHGVLDIPSHSHVLFDTDSTLMEGIRHVAGEPRCLQLYFEPDASPARRALTVARWREAESGRAWIATRSEAIAAGWFGEVRDEVEPRIGDLLIAARRDVAYYQERSRGRSMVGQHGSWSPAETRVPLLRFGAFAA